MDPSISLTESGSFVFGWEVNIWNYTLAHDGVASILELLYSRILQDTDSRLFRTIWNHNL